MKFKSYFENIPDFIIDFFKAIKSPFRQNILEIIFENDSMSMSKLEETTMKPSGYISSQIHQLELSNILQNFIKKTEGKRDYSFYEFTEIGKIFYRYYLILVSQKLLEIDFDRNTLNVMANKFRFGILLFLNEYNQASYSTLKKQTQEVNRNLAHHLHLLEKTHLVQNFLKKEPNRSDFSYYRITELGKMITWSTTEVYNLSIGKREYLEEFMSKLNKKDLKTTNPSIQSNENEGIRKNEISSDSSISAHFASWALPNEPILGWIQMLSKKVDKIKITLSKILHLKEICSTNLFEEDRERKEVIFNNIIQNKINFYSIEIVAEVPQSNSMLNHELIEIYTYDEDEKLIEKISFTVDIIKPIVELFVNNTDLNSKSGYFDIIIKIPKGYNLELGDLLINVKNKEGKDLKIIKEDLTPQNYPQNIPPEIISNNLIGNIKFQDSGPFYVKFMIKYYDAMKNEYTVESSELKILDSELKQNILNLRYDFQKAGVVA